MENIISNSLTQQLMQLQNNRYREKARENKSKKGKKWEKKNLNI